MTSQTYLTAIASLISLTGILYLLLWRYPSLSMDSFRQSMFELRDELFDYAASGQIGFDHPAYAVLRNTMNGYLQFGHRFNALQALVFFLLLSKDDKKYMESHSFDQAWARAVKGLTDEQKNNLEAYRDKMHALTMKYIVISSPFCLAALIPLIVALMVALLLGQILKSVEPRNAWLRIRRRFDRTDNVALIFGDHATA